MIRLTVEQLFALQRAIDAGGQAKTTVLPLQAMMTHRLIVAWAKGRSAGTDYYLSVWRDTKSWDEAIAKDQAGEPLPYDFIKDSQSVEYTHNYPVVSGEIKLVNAPTHMPSDEFFYKVRMLASGRIAYSEDPDEPEDAVERADIDSAEFAHKVNQATNSFSQGSAADSGHPEFGVTHGE